MATFPRTRNSRSVSPPKRKPRLDAGSQLPFRSANPDPLQEMGETSPPDSSNPLSPVAERLAGYVSPLRARTMKEYDQQICDLKKENFHLKLRMYFLEEKMDKKFEGDILDLHKLNLQLQVDAETLHKELEQKHSLLEEALGTLEKLENNHKQEIHSIKTRAGNEKAALEKKIDALQKQFSTSSIKYGLEESDASRRSSVSDPSTSSDLASNWTKFESDRKIQNEIQELKKTITIQGQELQVTKLQLEEERKRENCLENELHSRDVLIHNFSETLQHREKDIQHLKKALELKSGAIDMINGAVHTAVYKATMAARKGDKIGITTAREELKTVLRKILLQCTEDDEGIDRHDRKDIADKLKYLQEELIIKDETIKSQQEELDKTTERLNHVQATFHTLQLELTQQGKQQIEKDSLINRLQASLKDAEHKIENLLKEQNEIITISKKSLQTLQSNIKDKDSIIHDLQKNIKKTIEQKDHEIDKLQRDLLEKDRDLNSAKHSIDILNTDVAANKMECEEVKRDIDEYRNKLSKLTNETKNVTEKLDMATKELNELRKNKEEEIDELSQRLQEIQKEMQLKECNMNELQKTVKYKDEELNRIEDDYNKLQNKVEKLENFLMQKEEEVFASFQIIDEMRRIIQGSISKDKLHGRADLKKFQDFDNQDLSQSNILKNLKLKLGNYTNISTEYSKQLELTVALLLQHVYNTPQKFAQPHNKLEDVQCLLNTFQQTTSDLHNNKWKKYKNHKEIEQLAACADDTGLNQLSDRNCDNEYQNYSWKEYDIGDNKENNTKYGTVLSEDTFFAGNKNKEADINNQYQVNIEPTETNYYDNHDNIDFATIRTLPHSYSDIALRISNTPPPQRSVESLPAEIEMCYEGWNPDFLPPPILPQSLYTSTTLLKEQIQKEDRPLNNLWSQSLSQFGHSNDIQELKEEIRVLILKLRQLWEQNFDMEMNSPVSKQYNHTKELEVLQQQLHESEQLTNNLQQHMADMAIFLKQLLEIEPSSTVFEKLEEKKDIASAKLKKTQELAESFKHSIDKETLHPVYNEPQRTFESSQIVPEECYFDTDPCEIKTDFAEHPHFNDICIEHGNRSQFADAGSSSRKWWSASPLHIPHGEWVNSEVTKIQDNDTWNGTDQVVVLEASDSDDILLLLNDRGLPKDVFLCNNLQQSWSSQSCWPIINNSPPSSVKQVPTKDVCEKPDHRVQQWIDPIPVKCPEPRNQVPGLSHWSSDSDIWSEPDREVSMQRIGVDLSTIQTVSGEPIGPVLETLSSHKTHLQQALNRIGSSDDSPLPTNRTSPSSSSRGNTSKWKQKLEFYMHKLEGLISTLSLELQHHRNLSGEVVAQLTMLPASEKDIINSGLSSIVQDYSQTMILLEERIGELISDNKQLQDIMQKKLVGKGYGRKRTSNSDSSRKNAVRKSKNSLQVSAATKEAQKSDLDSKLLEYQENFKKLESLLDKKNKECERLMKVNEILEAKCSYSCFLDRHETIEDSLSNVEWDKEEVKSLKHEIEVQEQREKQIEHIVLQMKDELEKKDHMWQDVQNKLAEYKDINEHLEIMCKDKDCQLENAYETINKLQEEIYSKGEEITGLKSLIDELNHDIEQCRKRSVGLEEQSIDRQHELEQTRDRMKDIETKCAELQKNLQESNASKSELLHKNLNLEDQLSATEQKLQYHKLEREKQTMECEIKANDEKRAIQNEIFSLEDEIKGLKSQLHHMSTMQLVQNHSSNDSGSRKNSIELDERVEGDGKISSDHSKEQGYLSSSYQDENALLLDLVTEMRQLRTELNTSMTMRKKLHQQIKCAGKNETDQKSIDLEYDQTLSDLSLGGSSTGTLTGSRMDSLSSASVESSDSFSYLIPPKQRDKSKINSERKSKKKASVQAQKEHINKTEVSLNLLKPDMSFINKSPKSPSKYFASSVESEKKLEIDSVSENSISNSCKNFPVNTKKQVATNRKNLKLELPLNRPEIVFTQSSPKESSGDVTPHSSKSDQKGASWSQESSIDSPNSRAQFSSPDLGIESDPNRENYFLPPETKESGEWESAFPSRMSITSAHSAPITIAHDYSPQQEITQYSTDADVKSTGKPHKAVIIQNDYSLHAIGRLEDYELLKKVMEEALSSLKEISTRIKQLYSSVTPTNKLLVHDVLRDIDSSCHDVRIWLVKGWHLISSFQTTAYVQEMQIRNVTLLKENQWLQEELVSAREEVSHVSKQLRDVSDKLQIAKGEKQLMENTITWHLTRTCRKLQEARSNLIRKDLLEMQQY